MANKCPKCDYLNPSDSKFCKECGTQLIPSKEVPEVTKTLEASSRELKNTLIEQMYKIKEKLGEVGIEIICSDVRG